MTDLPGIVIVGFPKYSWLPQVFTESVEQVFEVPSDPEEVSEPVVSPELEEPEPVELPEEEPVELSEEESEPPEVIPEPLDVVPEPLEPPESLEEGESVEELWSSGDPLEEESPEPLPEGLAELELSGIELPEEELVSLLAEESDSLELLPDVVVPESLAVGSEVVVPAFSSEDVVVVSAPVVVGPEN